MTIPPTPTIDALITSMATHAFTPEQRDFFTRAGFIRGPVFMSGEGDSYTLATLNNWYCALPDEQGIILGCESRDQNATITSEEELLTFIRDNP